MDSLSLNMFSPYTLLSARITSNSKILIANTFSNHVSNEVISGNLTVTISYYLPQVLITPDIFGNLATNKPNVFTKK